MVGWQTEQQRERRRRWRSIRKEDVNVPKSVMRMRMWRREGSRRFRSTLKRGTANHMAEEEQSPIVCDLERIQKNCFKLRKNGNNIFQYLC